MATEYTGGGDPIRSIELLWGVADAAQPGRRGPKPRLSVPSITRAAVEVADAEGMGALSMRRVAEHLGVSVMSLYTYVPGKAELVDLMLDLVCGEAVQPADSTDATDDGPGGWRARLDGVARRNWALLRRHPWLLQIAATARPPLGPNVIAKYDHELQAVEGVGLTDVEMDAALTLVLGHTEGAARRAVEMSQAEQRTGMSDDQWWAASAPLLAKVFDAERFPTAARVGAAAGEALQAAYDPEHAFEFGLQRILDGIEALIDRRRQG
jgi:AcrR family transcriptional regulator